MLDGCTGHPVCAGPVALPPAGPQGSQGTLWLSQGVQRGQGAPSNGGCWVPQDHSAPSLHPQVGGEAALWDRSEYGGQGSGHPVMLGGAWTPTFTPGTHPMHPRHPRGQIHTRVPVRPGVMSPVAMAMLLHHCVAACPSPGISAGAVQRGLRDGAGAPRGVRGTWVLPCVPSWVAAAPAHGELPTCVRNAVKLFWGMGLVGAGSER